MRTYFVSVLLKENRVTKSEVQASNYDQALRAAARWIDEDPSEPAQRCRSDRSSVAIEVSDGKHYVERVRPFGEVA